jgi:RNA polymerase sigma-70 factor (ECF subfamily)
MPRLKKETAVEELDQRRALFEREALPHLSALYNLAYHLTHNQTQAQDLVQDAVLRAYRFFHLYQPGTNCKAWLFKILRNTFINEYRRRKRQPQQLSVDELEGNVATNRKETALGGPGDGAGKAESRQLLRQGKSNQLGFLGDEITQALSELPDEFRVAVMLSDLEELSYKDIAEIMDTPVGTVRSRISRGRGMLRDKLYEFARRAGIVGKRR